MPGNTIDGTHGTHGTWLELRKPHGWLCLKTGYTVIYSQNHHKKTIKSQDVENDVKLPVFSFRNIRFPKNISPNLVFETEVKKGRLCLESYSTAGISARRRRDPTTMGESGGLHARYFVLFLHSNGEDFWSVKIVFPKRPTWNTKKSLMALNQCGFYGVWPWQHVLRLAGHWYVPHLCITFARFA